MDELVRRCTAMNRDGDRCGKPPIPGGSVCFLHGGKAPQTVAAAKLRLLEGVEPAIARLMRFIESPPGLCQVCGRSDDTSAIVSAIRTVLDRCGLGPHATMEVVKPENEYASMSDDELIASLEGLLKDAYQRRDFKRLYDRPRLGESVIDGVELAEDGDISLSTIETLTEPEPVAEEPISSEIRTIEDWTSDGSAEK